VTMTITDTQLAAIASVAYELEELRQVGADVTRLRDHVDREHCSGATVVRIDRIRRILGWPT
jgi:hypothetical protein